MSARTPTPATVALARELAIERAQRDTEAITQLLESPGWAYFSRRLAERRDLLRDRLADDDTLDDQSTRALRKLIREYRELLALPAQDRALHQSTLASLRNQANGPRLG